MIDFSKPKSKEILLKLGLSESKIEGLATRQHNGEKIARFIKIVDVEGKEKLVKIPDSPEEIEKREKARERRLRTNRERNKRLIEKQGFKSRKEYRDDLAKRKGFKDEKEHRKGMIKEIGFEKMTDYYDYLSKKRGFEDYHEYRNLLRYKKGERVPLGVNIECASYLGVYIAENLLPDIFDNPEMMPFGNEGYDAICKSGYKINVKSSCLRNEGCSEYWQFMISENKIANYFLLVAFDNRETLNIQHIWLIKGDERVTTKFSRNRKLNDFKGITIVNSAKALYIYKKYELSEDKINKAKKSM